MSAAGALKDALRPVWRRVKAVRESLSSKCKWAYGRRLAREATVKPNKVVLSCNFGRGYLCNPKYVAEALERLYPGKFDLVLLVKERDNGLPGYLRQVKYGSRKAQRELATARFWVYNFRNDEKFVPKRDGQIYIQTWHACLGPKRSEGDVADQLGDSYLAAAQYDGSITDFMIANNRLEAEKYQRAFWYSGPVVRAGVPRNAPLIRPADTLGQKMRRVLGVDEGVAICLYAPTFRADWSFEQYEFDFQAVVEALEARFQRPFVFAYRLHPNLASKPRPNFFLQHIDATDYEDTQQLLAATSVLISDYSSIMEDFLLTGRPGFQYIPDLAEYMDDRGLYYPLERRPYPIASNEKELLAAIESFDFEVFENKRRSFFEYAGFVEDGKGDERIANLMHDLASPGSSVSCVFEPGEIWDRTVTAYDNQHPRMRED